MKQYYRDVVLFFRVGSFYEVACLDIHPCLCLLCLDSSVTSPSVSMTLPSITGERTPLLKAIEKAQSFHLTMPDSFTKFVLLKSFPAAQLYEEDAQIGADILGWKLTLTGVGACRQAIFFLYYIMTLRFRLLAGDQRYQDK